MSQELDAPKMPTGTYPELSPNPNSEGLKLKDGGRGTPVVVNTEPRKANTNTITVNEVKRLIREAIDHFEKEEGGVTEEELNAALATKADKIGGLPYFEVSSTDKVVEFITKNGLSKEKPIILSYEPVAHAVRSCYIGTINFSSWGDGDGAVGFEFELLSGVDRYTAATVVVSSSTTFASLFSSDYLKKYALDENVAKIHKYDEDTVLTESIMGTMKSGDILRVDNTYFIITVQTNADPKKIIGNCISSFTSSSISLYNLNWAVGDELHPTLTTLTIPSAE